MTDNTVLQFTKRERIARDSIAAAIARSIESLRADLQSQLKAAKLDTEANLELVSERFASLSRIADLALERSEQTVGDVRHLSSEISGKIQGGLDGFQLTLDRSAERAKEFESRTAEQIGNFADDLVALTDDLQKSVADLEKDLRSSIDGGSEALLDVVEDGNTALRQEIEEARRDAFSKIDGQVRALAVDLRQIGDQIVDLPFEQTAADAFLKAQQYVGEKVEEVTASLTRAIDEQRKSIAASIEEAELRQSEAREMDARVHDESISGLDDRVRVREEALHSSIGKLDDSVLDLDRRVMAAKASIAELRGALEDAVRRNDAAHAEHLDKMGVLRRGIESLDQIPARVDVLAGEATKLHADLSGLVVRLSAAEASLEEHAEYFAGEIAGLSETQSALRKEVDERDARAVTSPMVTEILTAAIENLEASVEVDLAKAEDAVREHIDEVSDNILKEAEERNKDVQGAIDDLKDCFERAATLADVEEALGHATGDMRREFLTRIDEAVDASAVKTIEAMRGLFGETRDWTSKGPAYPRSSIVTHRAGMWHALAETRQEPGKGGDWLAIAIGYEVFTRSDPERGCEIVELRDSNGKSTVVEIPWHQPNYSHRTWDPDVVYKKWDVVTRDGNRYIALVLNPKGDPLKSDQWGLYSLRGLRGRKGEKGDPPSEADIVKALTSYMDQQEAAAEGVPVRRFRGTWAYQRAYSPGDVCVYESALYVAVQDDDGMIPPVGVPGSMGNASWQHMFSVSMPQIPHNVLLYEPNYQPGETTVSKNTQVSRNGWLAVSNKQTSDYPDPQNSGDPSYDMSEAPTWDLDPSHAGVAYTGHKYVLTQPGFIKGLQVWVPEITADIRYRFLMANKTDPDNPIYASLDGPVLNEDAWTTLAVDNKPFAEGTVFEVVIDALNSGSDTTWQHEWLYTGTSNTGLPGAGECNRHSQQNIFRANYTADDGDRYAELATIIPGSTLRLANVADLNQYWQYHVNGVTDDAVNSVFIFDVVLESTGVGGDVPVSAMSLLTATIPTPQPTKYKELTDHWTGNQPDWATITGVKTLDGVVDPAAQDHAYGVRLLFQPAYVSPDWDILAYSEEL